LHREKLDGSPESQFVFKQWNEAIVVEMFVAEADDFRQAPAKKTCQNMTYQCVRGKGQES